MPFDQKNCSSEEYARWEARFAPPDYAFGKEPNYFLKSCQKLLPRSGRVLAVADGEGRNGVCGWRNKVSRSSRLISRRRRKRRPARSRPSGVGNIRSERSTWW